MHFPFFKHVYHLPFQSYLILLRSPGAGGRRILVGEYKNHPAPSPLLAVRLCLGCPLIVDKKVSPARRKSNFIEPLPVSKPNRNPSRS